MPPHHPVGFGLFFFAIPTGFVRVAHSTPWLFFAASPCGEAPDLACLTAVWRFTNGKLGGLLPASRAKLWQSSDTLCEPQASLNQEPRRMARRHNVAHGGAASAAEPWDSRKKQTEPHRMVGWHNAVATRLGVALAETEKHRNTLIHRFLSPRFTGLKLFSIF